MMTIEPKRIISPRCGGVIAYIDSNGKVNSNLVTFERGESLLEYYIIALQHFADHGTFCPEPEPPIEWTEVIPGVLWVSGEWMVLPYPGSYITKAFVVQRDTETFNGPCRLAEAKSYAEDRIREEARRVHSS